MARLLIVATLVAVAASCVLAGMNTDLTEQQHRQDAEERRPHHQALQDLNIDSFNMLKDTDAAMDVLQAIARRSTEDLRMLTRQVQQKRLDDERHLQEQVQHLEAQQPLLRQRRRRAKRSLTEGRRKATAAAQASLQHVQALAAEILTTLQEVKHLKVLQHNLQQMAQEVLARRQASWWPGFVARWRTRLVWLVRSCNSVPWFTAGQERDETQPAQDAPEETGPNESVGLASDAEQSPPQDAVAADDNTDEEAMMTDGVVSGKGEAGVPPSQAKYSGAALQFQYRPLPRWLLYPFAVLSYVILAFRIYARFRR